MFLATGKLPLVIANPATAQVLFRDASQLTIPQVGSLTSGWALALGSVPDPGGSNANHTVVVVAGSGTAIDPNNPTGGPVTGSVVGIMDLSQPDPTTPKPLGFFLLGAPPTDLQVRGSLAYVATSTNTIVLDIANPANVQQVGTIDNVSGHIALDSTNQILSTGLSSQQGGLHIAAIGEPDVESGPDLGPCKECEAAAGRPINVTNGNTWIEQNDYTLPGLGGGLQVVRTWNSQWRDVGPPQLVGLFGDSWTSNYEERVVIKPQVKATLWRGDGKAWTFSYNVASATYVLTDPVDERARFAFDTTTGRSTITFKDGTQELFGSNGYLLSQTDRNGNTTNLIYDTNNRLTQVTDATGRSIVLTYASPSSTVAVGVTDAMGSVATYSYDSSNRLTKVTYPDQSFVTFNYDASSMITSVLDAQGKVLESHTYDSSHRGLTSQAANGAELVTVTYPAPGGAQISDSLGNSTSYASQTIGKRSFITSTSGPGCSSCGAVPGSASYGHDSLGNRTSSVDALGRLVSMTYDAQGNVASRTATLNGTPVTYNYTYNSFAELLTASDPLGNTTSNTYDARGNLLSTSTPAGTTKFAYDSKGQLTTVTDPNGNSTALAYAPAGLVASITDAQNHVTQYTYDARGNRIKQVDALGNITSYAYDGRNRLTTTTYADGSTTKYAYDVRGRRTSVTDGNGAVTSYQYDDADRLIAVTDAAGHTTQYAYDSEGNLSAITDALSRTTSYTYDSQRRLTQTTYPSGLSDTYGYDVVGNRTSKTDRKGQTIQYAYDALNRLVSKTYPDSTSVRYAYDLDGRMIQAKDASGTYGFSYDSRREAHGDDNAVQFSAGQDVQYVVRL